MENSSIVPSYSIDRLANWMGTSVVAAFFASLERCSCINISTSDIDDEDENEEEAKDRPLMLTNLQVVSDENSIKRADDVANLPV